MRRYWLSVLLILFAGVGIGAYYAHGASDRLPEYRLAIVRGDPAEGRDVSLSGTYGGRMRSQVVEVSERGSMYQRDRSVYRQIRNALFAYERNETLHRLIGEHRGFMRGKTNGSGLYEDGERLIYVSVERRQSDSAVWELAAVCDTLHLGTGEVSRQVVVLDARSDRSWPYVADVQRLGGELHLMINVGGAFKVYRIDAGDGRLLESRQLQPPISTEAGEELGISLIQPTDYASPADVAVFVVHGAGKRTYAMTYSYAAGAIGAIRDISDTAVGGEQTRIQYRLRDNRLTVLAHDDAKLAYAAYGVSADAVGGDGAASVYSAGQLGGEAIRNLLSTDDRIYVLLRHHDVPQITVVDLASGAVAYQAEAVYDGPAAQADAHMAQLRLNNISVQSDER